MNGWKDFVGFGGWDKDYPGLFKGFKQRIACGGGKHVDFIYSIDRAAFCRE